VAAPRLIVTRPVEQAVPWVHALQALGCDAVALPLIRISALAELSPLRHAWQGLDAHALVMFVSANAVQHFFAAQAAGCRTWPNATLAASTGPGTTAALLAAGVPAAAVVQPAADAPSLDSEALWAQLRHYPWAGRSALVVRGEDGRDWLADALRAQGASVSYLAAYRRGAPTPDAAAQTVLAQALAAPQAHVWLFSSSEAVGHLLAWQRVAHVAAHWAHSQAYATHPRIAQVARDAGFGSVQLLPATPEAVAKHAGFHG
jgi:uroporphyrinogen-III synthase